MHNKEPLLKITLHQELVNFRAVDINRRMGAKIIMLNGSRGFCKFFKLAQCNFKFPEIAEIKMGIEQIMHALYIMPGFHGNHYFVFAKKIDPFLAITIIHKKILAYKTIPAITLVQI